jgi:hypothetical protein
MASGPLALTSHTGLASPVGSPGCCGSRRSRSCSWRRSSARRCRRRHRRSISSCRGISSCWQRCTGAARSSLARSHAGSGWACSLAEVALVVLVHLTYGDVWRGPPGPKLAAAGLCALLIALAPIPAGVLVIRRMARSGSFYGPDGLWVVTGILGFSSFSMPWSVSAAAMTSPRAPSPRHSRSGGYTSETDEHRRSQGARKRPGSIQSVQWASSNPLTGISSCIGPPRPQPGPGSRASLEGGDRGEIFGCGIYNEAATNQWRRMG